MYTKLFSPIAIGNKVSRNRISFEPMGNHYSNLDGSVSDRDIAFYGARAKGGCGIIISETCSINSKNGRANSRNICLDRDEIIPGMKKLADEVHKYGSLFFAEIYHPGRQGLAFLNGGVMMAPSAIMCQCVQQPVREMTTDDITSLRQDFISAAMRAKAAGCDGIELHAAHGYILNQFASPYTNKRMDNYGGSFENRTRLICEVIDGIKASCGEDFPIIVRLTVDEMLDTIGIDDGIKLPEGIKIAQLLESRGVAAIDVTCGIYETMNTSWEPCGYDEGWKDFLGKSVKAAVNVPVIAVSVMRTPEHAVKMINDGVCDIIGSARQFFSDPEWSNKIRDGKANEIRKCISCLNCMETLFASEETRLPCNCAINAESGEEFKLDIDSRKNGNGRKIAVIGAGPAGLEASRVLALRGFDVTLFEKSDSVGGQLKLACKPPKKDKIRWLIDYYESQLRALNITVRTNYVPEASELKEQGFENVIYAAGSSPVLPASIPGINGKNIYTPVQILSGEVELISKNICVVGSGMTGIETAELLAVSGNRVTLWEIADQIGPGIFFQNLDDVMSRLKPTGCAMHPNHQLIELSDNAAIFKNTKTVEITTCDFDCAVISLGVRPVPCPDELKKAFPDLIIIGDAEKGGRIRRAVESGYHAAYNL